MNTRAQFCLVFVSLYFLTACGGRVRPVAVPTPTDQQHPKFFVDVVEVTAAGKRYNVFRHGGEGAPPLEIVNFEVDDDSRLEVIFDHSQVPNTNIDAADTEISVRARVEGPDNNRDLEVRNYAAVGEQAVPASARIKSPAELAGLAGSQSSLLAVTASLDRIHENAAARVLRDRQRALQDREEERRQHLRALMAKRDELEVRRAEREDLLSSQPADTNARNALVQALEADITRLQGEIDAAAARIPALDRAAREAERTLEDRAAEGSVFSGARDEIAAARMAVVLEREVLNVPLSYLLEPANRSMVGLIARHTARNPQVLISQARALRDQWIPALAASQAANENTEATAQRDYATLQRIRGALQELSDVIGSLQTLDFNSGVLRQSLLADLRDTDIRVKETGARVGDNIIIEVTSGVAPRSRTLQVVMRVRDFGISTRVADSFLLVQRAGVDGTRDEGTLDSLREFISAAARNPAVTTKPDTVFRRQVDMNFEPVASITYGMTLNARRCHEQCPARHFGRFAEGANDFFAWLRPSVGLNVAFPSFVTQEISIRPTTDPNSPITETVTDVDRKLDVAVGVSLGILDNTAVMVYGRHLTSEKPDRYFALGFSFVRIVEGILQTTSR